MVILKLNSLMQKVFPAFGCRLIRQEHLTKAGLSEQIACANIKRRKISD